MESAGLGWVPANKEKDKKTLHLPVLPSNNLGGCTVS